MSAPPAAPDTKDWTWVLQRPCPQCGLDAAAVPIDGVGDALRGEVAAWATVLAGPGPRLRPEPAVWSPLEYAAHVRDVHRVFDARLRLLLEHDDPLFDDWDQDAAAREGRYDEQDPAVLADELAAAAQAVAARYDAVPADALGRRGRRGNGSAFTVASLARYHLHDVVHHGWDVRRAVTVAAYEAHAVAYRDASQALFAERDTGQATFAARLPAGSRVLEIGSGGGRDALALERLGLSVRRTDVTPAFVALLRGAGHLAEVLDPLTDDLTDDPGDDTGDGPGHASTGRLHDGVWANASLLHVARDDLPTVLRRLRGATRPGGVLRLSLKEGDGEAWSTHGSVAAPRLFVFWREDALRDVVGAAGWEVDEVVHSTGLRDERWLAVVAVAGSASQRVEEGAS